MLAAGEDAADAPDHPPAAVAGRAPHGDLLQTQGLICFPATLMTGPKLMSFPYVFTLDQA